MGGYFKEMRKCLSEDNYQDVSRLALFTNKNYLDNYRRLEVIRDGIECSSRGFRVISGCRDTSHEFDAFFREEFTSITTKGLEKTKKIWYNFDTFMWRCIKVVVLLVKIIKWCYNEGIFYELLDIIL